MKRSLIMALAVSLFFAAQSHAQDKGFSLGETFKDLKYTASLAIGPALPYKPETFDDNWDPSFGLMMEFSAGTGIVELSYTFDYNFFLSNGIDPDDQNIMVNFLTFKIKPLDRSIRPYILATAGLFSAWRVDTNVSENVLGYGGGAGIEIEVGDKRRIFVEGRLLTGQTRDDPRNFTKANTEYIPLRAGITFAFN